MFTAWVKNEYGDLVKQYDDCMNISVLPEHDMELKFPDIIDSIGVRSNYICLVDSSGRHFYPLYVYSVEIGQGGAVMDLLFLIKVFLVLGCIDYIINMGILFKEYRAIKKHRKIKRIGEEHERTGNNAET